MPARQHTPTYGNMRQHAPTSQRFPAVASMVADAMARNGIIDKENLKRIRKALSPDIPKY
jgi:hypothetical protein